MVHNARYFTDVCLFIQVFDLSKKLKNIGKNWLAIINFLLLHKQELPDMRIFPKIILIA